MIKKRIMLFVSLLSLSIGIAGCRAGYTMENFIRVAENYVEKLDELSTVEVVEDIEYQEKFKHNTYMLTVDSEDPNMHPKEDFLEVYHQQQGMEFDTDRTSFILVYKELLDEVVKELKASDVVKLDVFIEIEFESYGDMKLYCGFSDEDEIIVKMDYRLEDMRIFTAFKTGYDGDQFYVKEMNYYEMGTDINYGYSEYQEENYYFQLNFDHAEEYIYHYISEVDHEEILVMRTQSTEAEVSMAGYQMSWKDYLNQREFSFTINNEKEVIGEHIVFYNEYAPVFYYEDWSRLNDDIILRWNLIEADGWDFAYVSDEYPSANNALYKDGISLFPNDAVGGYINPHHVNLLLTKHMTIDQLNNEVLNLSSFGLTFLMTELSIEYLNTVREDAIETLLSFDKFSNLNVFNQNFTDSFIELMDKDLSFIE